MADNHIESKLNIVRDVFLSFVKKVSSLSDEPTSRITAGKLVEQISSEMNGVLKSQEIAQLVSIIGTDFPGIVKTAGRFGGYYKDTGRPTSVKSNKKPKASADTINKLRAQIEQNEKTLLALKEQQSLKTSTITSSDDDNHDDEDEVQIVDELDCDVTKEDKEYQNDDDDDDDDDDCDDESNDDNDDDNLLDD